MPVLFSHCKSPVEKFKGFFSREVRKKKTIVESETIKGVKKSYCDNYRPQKMNVQVDLDLSWNAQ